MKLLVILCIVHFATGVDLSQLIRPVELRVEYQQNPLAIDVPRPRLSWLVVAQDDKLRGLKQIGYQVIVSSTLEKLNQNQGDLWDTDKVVSNQSIHIPYGGQRLLQSQDVCYWKVRLWDNNDQQTEFSASAKWEIGLLTHRDWEGAQWIGTSNPKPQNVVQSKLPLYHCQQVRKTFQISKVVTDARLHVTAKGIYESYINGKRVSLDDHFAPGYTDYNKRIPYQTYDVSSYLQKGNNL